MTVAQWLARAFWLVEIVLGVLFWVGIANGLVLLHMAVGLLFVLCLWAVSLLAGRRGVPPGLVAGGLVWGLLILVIGMIQTSLLPGSSHWIIQVIHLLLGIGGIGLVEMLGARARRLIG